MSAAGVTPAGLAIAVSPLAEELITIPADGLKVTEGKMISGDFQGPIYEAYPMGGRKYPADLVIPEVFGMYYHI